LKYYILLLFLILPLFSQAQTICTLESRQKLEEMFNQFSQEDLSSKSPNELVITIGKEFLKTPYVEKTLEIPGEEKLVINLTGLDCTTYLETVVTLVRLAAQGEFTFGAFEKELENLRYRNSENQGYPSRLHYFSDWIYVNEKKGILKDITQEIGGKPYENKPTFMAKNPQYYPQLSNKENLEQIQNTEAAIAIRDYFYIPKDQIQSLEKNIQSGDLISITSSMANLDIVHTGFAIAKNGRIHLMHASSKNGEVEISFLPLSDYLKGNKSQSGIIVSRLTHS
jgi:hypothetical protein